MLHSRRLLEAWLGSALMCVRMYVCVCVRACVRSFQAINLANKIFKTYSHPINDEIPETQNAWANFRVTAALRGAARLAPCQAINLANKIFKTYSRPINTEILEWYKQRYNESWQNWGQNRKRLSLSLILSCWDGQWWLFMSSKQLAFTKCKSLIRFCDRI